jgi:hypothetical protein
MVLWDSRLGCPLRNRPEAHPTRLLGVGPNLSAKIYTKNRSLSLLGNRFPNGGSANPKTATSDSLNLGLLS